MTPRGVGPWGVQTGPFAACQTDFVPPKKPPFYPASHNKPFLYTAGRGGKEGAGAENGNRELFKSG